MFKIADVVYEHRVELPGQIRWINTRTMAVNVDKRYTYYMEMSDRYLYEGIMGMAVFRRLCQKWKPEHQISGVYETIIKELFAYTDLTLENGTENLHTGIFFGESSIVYGYQLLYK